MAGEWGGGTGRIGGGTYSGSTIGLIYIYIYIFFFFEKTIGLIVERYFILVFGLKDCKVMVFT